MPTGGELLKQVVLFGSGTVAETCLHLNPAFIVDNNPDLQGREFHGIRVQGNTHGLVRMGDGYAYTHQGMGIVTIASDFSLQGTIHLPPGMRPHGLWKYEGGWLVACNTGDCLLHTNGSGDEIARYRLSD